MGNFDEAKRFNGAALTHGLHTRPVPNPSNPLLPALLLEKEPSNMQAHSLSQLIEKGVTRGTHLRLSLLYPRTHLNFTQQRVTSAWP